jgi:hypothetical protein
MRDAYGSDMLKVNRLAFTGGKFQGKNYHPYLLLPNEHERLSYRSEIQWDFDLYNNPDFRIFWDNKVTGLATDVQYRYVSWDFQTGFSFGQVDVFFGHISEHSLERVRPEQHYPLQNSVNVRLNLIENERKRSWIWR